MNCRNIKLMTTSHPFSASKVSQKYKFRFSEIAIDPAIKLLRRTPHSLSTCWGLSKPDLSPNKMFSTQVARRVMGGKSCEYFHGCLLKKRRVWGSWCVCSFIQIFFSPKELSQKLLSFLARTSIRWHPVSFGIPVPYGNSRFWWQTST